MHITVATSIKYGNYQQHLRRTNEVVGILHRLHKAFADNFDFRRDVNVHIRPIRGSVHGKAYNEQNKIEIDPRYEIERIVETIAHELTHSEQYKQGRLKAGPRGFREWNSKLVKIPQTFKDYENSPWEVEARDRAAKFVQMLKAAKILT